MSITVYGCDLNSQKYIEKMSSVLNNPKKIILQQKFQAHKISQNNLFSAQQLHNYAQPETGKQKITSDDKVVEVKPQNSKGLAHSREIQKYSEAVEIQTIPLTFCKEFRRQDGIQRKDGTIFVKIQPKETFGSEGISLNSSQSSQEDMTDLWNLVSGNKPETQEISDKEEIHKENNQVSSHGDSSEIDLNEDELLFCFGTNKNPVKPKEQSPKNQTTKPVFIKDHSNSSSDETLLNNQEFMEMWEQVQIDSKKIEVLQEKSFENLQLESSPQKGINLKENQDNKANEEQCEIQKIFVSPLSKIEMQLFYEISSQEILPNKFVLLPSIDYFVFNNKKFLTEHFLENSHSYFALRTTTENPQLNYILYSIETGEELVHCNAKNNKYFFSMADPNNKAKIGCLHELKKKKKADHLVNFQLSIFDQYQNAYLAPDAQIQVRDGYFENGCYCDTIVIPMGPSSKLKNQKEILADQLTMNINRSKNGTLTTNMMLSLVKKSSYNCTLENGSSAAFSLGVIDPENMKFVIRISHPFSVLMGMATAVARIQYINKCKL